MSTLLPDEEIFLFSYVRKEAVLSSQIEGTQSSLLDLLLFELEEAPGIPLDDARKVSNHVAALQHGLSRLREGFPLSNRLLRGAHRVLLSGGRGVTKLPGEFRRSQNWIGGTSLGNAAFVPPPHTVVPDCMSELERFLHAKDDGSLCCCARGSHTSSSRPFTHSSTATGALSAAHNVAVVPCWHAARPFCT